MESHALGVSNNITLVTSLAVLPETCQVSDAPWWNRVCRLDQFVMPVVLDASQGVSLSTTAWHYVTWFLTKLLRTALADGCPVVSVSESMGVIIRLKTKDVNAAEHDECLRNRVSALIQETDNQCKMGIPPAHRHLPFPSTKHPQVRFQPFIPDKDTELTPLVKCIASSLPPYNMLLERAECIFLRSLPQPTTGKKKRAKTQSVGFTRSKKRKLDA